MVSLTFWEFPESLVKDCNGSSLKASNTNSPSPQTPITRFEFPHTCVIAEWWKCALDSGNEYVLNSLCLRNENCCTCEEGCFLPPDLPLEQPRKTESPREKTDCTLTPSFGIFRPTPPGWRKSKILMESGVQKTPSFPSASDELTLHLPCINHVRASKGNLVPDLHACILFTTKRKF